MNRQPGMRRTIKSKQDKEKYTQIAQLFDHKSPDNLMLENKVVVIKKSGYLLHLYKRLERRGRALLLCLLCAEAGWLILVNAWLRLERAYLKLRLFLRV